MGISHIICGFRDDRGMVHKLENFEVVKLPKMAGVSSLLVMIHAYQNVDELKYCQYCFKSIVCACDFYCHPSEPVQVLQNRIFVS